MVGKVAKGLANEEMRMGMDGSMENPFGQMREERERKRHSSADRPFPHSRDSRPVKKAVKGKWME